jgi:hypothetical protein
MGNYNCVSEYLCLVCHTAEPGTSVRIIISIKLWQRTNEQMQTISLLITIIIIIGTVQCQNAVVIPTLYNSTAINNNILTAADGHTPQI